MQIEVVKSKIHRVKVTDAELDYIGSITLDEDLMYAAGIIPGERVYIVNVNNGERFDTYTISGGSGTSNSVLFVSFSTPVRARFDSFIKFRNS